MNVLCRLSDAAVLISILFAIFSVLNIVDAQQTFALARSFPSAAPCSGLFHSSGFTGCSSKRDTAANVGSLKFFSDMQTFTQAVSDKSFLGSWIIPTSIWCNLTRTDLEALNPIASSLLVVETNDQPIACGPSGLDSTWDKLGSGTTKASLNYPVARLAASDTGRLLKAANTPGNQQARFDFYMGKTDGSVNSSYCLGLDRCGPLGGLSVWGTVQSPPLSSSDRAILLAANMDSTAFFHDLSFGFHAAGGDIAIALATTQALAVAPRTATRILTGIFQGETFARIGSRRFLEDILVGQCSTFSNQGNSSCADPPNFSLEYTKFGGDIARIRGVISLSNVLRADNAVNKSYVHALESASNFSDDIAARLSLELSRLGWEAPLPLRKPPSALPPSVLDSFSERPSWMLSNETGGIVFAGYESDISEANPQFQTENDAMDAARIDTYVDRATLFSTALARSLFFVASNGTESNITTSRELVYELLRCFGGSFALDCPMALSALNLTSAQLASNVVFSAFSANSPYTFALNKSLPSYTGVYFRLAPLSGRVKLREAFIRNVLANFSIAGAIPAPGGLDENAFHCNSDITCRDDWDGVASCTVAASNASAACVGGRCICSTVFFHEAWSPSLVLDRTTGVFVISNGTLLDTAIWTEPFWQAAALASFATSSTVDIAISLTVGILLTVLAAVGIQMVKNREGRLGKLKLA